MSLGRKSLFTCLTNPSTLHSFKDDNAMIHELNTSHSDILIHWFNNPVALFLSSPESCYPIISVDDAFFKDTQTYGYFQDEQLVACVSVRLGQILHLFVEPKHRKKGYAKALLKFLLKQDKSELYAYVHGQQREQIRLFSSVNFLKTAEVSSFSFENIEEEFIKFISE